MPSTLPSVNTRPPSASPRRNVNPRTSAPTTTCIGVLIGSLVPFVISIRTTATRPKVKKKKVVGGISAKNYSLIVSDASPMSSLFRNLNFGVPLESLTDSFRVTWAVVNGESAYKWRCRWQAVN